MKTKKNIKSILLVIVYVIWQSLLLSCILFLSLSYAGHNPKIIGYFLSEYTGKSIKIRDIQYDFNLDESSVCLVIDNFEMSDEKYGELQDLIKSKNTVIDINIKSLFTDTIQINNISFYGADFNVNLFDDGDTFFDKYSESEPHNVNILVHNCELDSCYISYNNYKSHIDDFNLEQISEYQISAFIYYAKLDVSMFIEDTKDCLNNNYLDTYCFMIKQCNGNLILYRFNDQELANREFEIFNSGIKYIYKSESDNYLVNLDIPDTAYFGDIFFNEFLLTVEDGPENYSGEIYGNFGFPLTSNVCSDISEMLDYDFDSLLLSTATNNEINVVLQNLKFAWECDNANDFEKLFFKSDCALSGTTDNCFFNLKGLKQIDSDFCLVYSYDSIAGEESDSVIIKDLNIKALNSVLFSNKEIVLSSINSDSELDIDIGFDADLSYLKQLQNSEIIEELSGRMSTKSIKIKALLSDFSIEGLSKILKKIEIEDAQIYSATLKIKDFSSKFQNINATLSLISSNFRITESNFIFNNNRFFLTGEAYDFNHFFNDSLIKLSAFISADTVDLNNLSEIFKNGNNVKENSEKSQKTFLDRLEINLSLAFDNILFQIEINVNDFQSILVRIKKQIDSCSPYYESVLANSKSNTDLKITDFISDLRFFNNNLILSNCDFNFYGVESSVSGMTIFDSTFLSQYLINLKNIDLYRIESESGLSIAKFINSSEKIYPYIDSISATIDFSFDNTSNLFKIVIPESFAYFKKIDCFFNGNLTGIDSITEYHKNSFKELANNLKNTNHQQYDSNIKHETDNFSIEYGKLIFFIENLFLMNSKDGTNMNNDTLLNIKTIKADPVYNKGQLTVNEIQFGIFDGLFYSSNIAFSNNDIDIFDFAIQNLNAEFLQFSEILNVAMKSGYITDELYNKISSVITDFDISLSGDVIAKDVEYDMIELSLDGIIEMSEFNFVGSLSDFKFSYKDSVKEKKTDLDHKKNGKAKNRENDDTPSVYGYDYNIGVYLRNLKYSIISDSTDLSLDFEGKLNNVPFKLDYTEGEKYNILAEDIQLNEFVAFSDSSGSIVDIINNLNISKFQISSDSSSKIRMSIKLDDFSFEVPRFINFVITEANISQLLSKTMHVKEFELNLKMVDSIMNEHDTVPIIILEQTNTVINDCFTLLVSGEYYEKTLYLKLFLYPFNGFGQSYCFDVIYKDDSIRVYAEGRGLLNLIFQKLLGKHEKYIIETLDTTYEEFRNINKTNKKLIKKEKKNKRKNKRKNKKNR
ncbi:MAG TPA: hypothetical protein PKN32_00920 [Bacteroidales bacterium]|nr:hypothetical protein [Bacteroidales bacterium]